MGDIGWIDGVFVGVVGLSTLIGLWRGLVFEVMSIMGWLVAYFGAQWWAHDLAPYLPVGTPGSALNHLAAFACTFIAVLVAWCVLSRLVRMAVKATPLSVIDRFLGAAFGLLRGGVIALAAVTIAAMTPASRSAAWQQAQSVRWLQVALQGLAPLLPEAFRPYLPTQVRSLRGGITL